MLSGYFFHILPNDYYYRCNGTLSFIVNGLSNGNVKEIAADIREITVKIISHSCWIVVIGENHVMEG